MRVRPLDNHITRGIHIDIRWVAGVGLHEPDDDRNVVSDPLKWHGNGAVGLEEVDGTTIVVREGSGFGFERRVSADEGEKVLAD